MKEIHITILILLASISLNAQPFNFDISFALGSPQGDFGQSLNRNAYGLDAAFTYQLGREIPLHL